MAKFFKVNVSVVIFNDAGQVLIQKRAADEEVFPGLWGIPGGTVEMTDASLEDALAREVAEEVGVSIEGPQILRNNIRPKELYAMLYLVYTAKYLSGEARPIDGTESVHWAEQSEIDTLEFTPTTRDTIMYAYERKDTRHSV